MGFEEVDQCVEPSSTPKLTLSKLPFCKPIREPPLMQTPPLRPSVSIPFQWEEAPGKPRSTADAPPSETSPSSRKKAACRSLDLPPRLMMSHDDAKITIMSSPTTVFDGPYVGRSLSLACTFSFRKGPVAAGREEGMTRGGGGARNFDSGRWASFSDEEGKFVRGSFDFSHSLGDFFKSEENVKITRVRRRRSLFNLSAINSNSWANIYASLKQAAVPWRRSRR